jgi:hypothetical protein
VKASRPNPNRNRLIVETRSPLPYLGELHKVQYARYPQIEVKPVPVYISEYEHMLDQLFADLENAVGTLGRASNEPFLIKTDGS